MSGRGGERPRRGFFVTLLTAVITIAVLGAAGAAGLWFAVAGPGPASHKITVVTRHGAGVGELGATLKHAGVISSVQLFRLAAELTGDDRRLRPGEYEFDAHASLFDVLEQMVEGKVKRHWVTIPEGRTSAQAVAILKAEPVLTGEVEVPPEGSLLPQTYEITRGESRAEVIRQMRAGRDALVADLWAHRRPGLPYKTPEEAVTLASIVEKETAVAAERRHVAAVYINRLNKGMKLDADPTTIYGISKGEPLGRGIRASELAAATPYNTYVITGLPPTPIANPGKASLEAAFDPTDDPDLYFVANGTGGSSFAATYEAHAKNVAKYREWEAAQKAKAAAGRR